VHQLTVLFFLTPITVYTARGLLPWGFMPQKGQKTFKLTKTDAKWHHVVKIAPPVSNRVAEFVDDVKGYTRSRITADFAHAQ
jgi:hypothetical protein